MGQAEALRDTGMSRRSWIAREWLRYAAASALMCLFMVAAHALGLTLSVVRAAAESTAMFVFVVSFSAAALWIAMALALAALERKRASPGFRGSAFGYSLLGALPFMFVAQGTVAEGAFLLATQVAFAATVRPRAPLTVPAP